MTQSQKLAQDLELSPARLAVLEELSLLVSLVALQGLHPLERRDYVWEAGQLLRKLPPRRQLALPL